MHAIPGPQNMVLPVDTTLGPEMTPHPSLLTSISSKSGPPAAKMVKVFIRTPWDNQDLGHHIALQGVQGNGNAFLPRPSADFPREARHDSPVQKQRSGQRRRFPSILVSSISPEGSPEFGFGAVPLFSNTTIILDVMTKHR